MKDKLEIKELQHFVHYSIDCINNYQNYNKRIPDVGVIIKILNKHSGEKEMSIAHYEKLIEMAAKSNNKNKKYSQFEHMHEYKCKICSKDNIVSKIDQLISYLNKTKP